MTIDLRLDSDYLPPRKVVPPLRAPLHVWLEVLTNRVYGYHVASHPFRTRICGEPQGLGRSGPGPPYPAELSRSRAVVRQVYNSPEMRIVAGSRRGLRLATVAKGDLLGRLRPTSGRVRENLFNILVGGKFGDAVTDSRVLDLFAGTGALGLEALSRGAAHVSFVESGSIARTLIQKNINLMGAGSAARLYRRDATKLGNCQTNPFTLVFLDPPYGRDLGRLSLSSALAGGWLAPDALIVWEDCVPHEVPPGFALCEHRCYGGTHLTLARLVQA